MAKTKHDHASYYLMLKDKSVCIEDRLKLARVAWKSSNVFIPNKEQVLVDTLFGFLFNRKQEQLNGVECAAVWKCLCDILNTQKAKYTSTVILRPSASQVLINSLLSVNDVKVGHGHVKSLIGCCLAIMKSSTLSSVFSTKPEDMVMLLTGLCKVLKTNACDDHSLMCDLVTHSVEIFAPSVRAAPHQNMILRKACEYLLPAFISQWCDSPSDVLQKISEAVKEILCHRDHARSYEAYLNSQHSTEELQVHKKVKFVEQLFEVFGKLIQSEDGNRCCIYLPVFYADFITAECHASSHAIAHHMTLELCHLIGLHHDNTSLTGPVAPPMVFKGVNCLLLEVITHGLYDQTGENAGIQLQFYKHIVAVLLSFGKSERLTVEWFRSLRTLLELNHQLLEPSLTQLFTVTLLHAQVSETELNDLDLLLCDLVVTYQKLRQVPKFITKLLDALGGAEEHNNIPYTPLFWSRYGEMVQSLPQGVMIDIWNLFYTNLKNNYVQCLAEGKKGHFEGICSLFTQFLLNVKVADYTVTDLTFTSVTDLLVAMETDILIPLLSVAFKQKQCDIRKVKDTLYLCHAVGEVMILLSVYKNYRASSFVNTTLVSHPGDVSYIHSYFDQSQWKKLYKNVMKTGDAVLAYLWDMLVMQKVKCLLIYQDVCPELAVALETTLGFTRKVKGHTDELTWTGKLEDVTDTNLLLARWHLLASNLAAIQRVLTDDQRRGVAKLALESSLSQTPVQPQSDMTVSMVTEKFILSKVMCESGDLVNDVITLLWQQCAACFSKQSQKTVKEGQRHKTVVSSLMSCLGDVSTPWSRDMNSKSLEKLQEASNLLADMFQDGSGHVHVTDWSIIQTCCQILKRLPLDQLWSCDQLRCVTGLLALKVIADSAKKGSHSQIDIVTNVSVMNTELCTLIISECGRIPVFQVLDVTSFLFWLQMLLNTSSQDQLRCMLLAEVSCFAMVKDYPVLEKLQPHAQLLSAKLSKKGSLKSGDTGDLTLTLFLLQPVCKLLNRAYLNDSLKTVCSGIYKCLAEAVLKLSPLIESSQLSHKEALLVRCYAVVLSSVHKDEIIKSEMLAVIPQILAWCTKVLESDMMKTEVHTILSALWFLLSSSRANNLLTPLFTQDIKLNIWNKLMTVVRTLLQNHTPISSNMPENHTLVGDNMQSADSINYFERNGKDTPRKRQRKRKLKDMEENELVSKSSRTGTWNALDINDNLEHFRKVFTKVTDINLVKSEHMMNGSGICPGIHTGLTSSSEDSIDELAKLSDDVLQFKCLVFEGRLESERSRLCLQQTQSALVAILGTFELEQFRDVIRNLEHDVHPGSLLKDRQKIVTSLSIWSHLLHLDFTEEQSKLVRFVAKDMMLNFQSITGQLQHCVSHDVLQHITIPILKTQHQMLILGKKFLPPRSRLGVLCLHSCIYTPLEDSTYFPAFQAVCNVLNALLVHHTDTVFLNVPTYIGCTKRLLLSVVEKSSQERVSGHTDVVSALVNCAYQLERLFSLIATHRVEFGKLAVYVVADYVTAVQKVTLFPAIKRGLVPSVYKMLDLCDTHAVSQLHVVLSDGVTSVFKMLYDDYLKFHKYSGKI